MRTTSTLDTKARSVRNQEQREIGSTQLRMTGEAATQVRISWNSSSAKDSTNMYQTTRCATLERTKYQLPFRCKMVRHCHASQPSTTAATSKATSTTGASVQPSLSLTMKATTPPCPASHTTTQPFTSLVGTSTPRPNTP